MPLDEFYGIDTRVQAPKVSGTWCDAVSTLHTCGLTCTRLAGHTGRHAATGAVRSNGLRPVFEVWADAPEVVAEPCS